MTPSIALVLSAPFLVSRRINWELDFELLLRGAGKALVIVVLAYLARWALLRVARQITQRAQAGDPATAGQRTQRAATLAQLLTHVGMIVIVIVALLLVLDIFINVTPLVASASVLGVAAGLGGQGVMKDVITGFLIVLEDQYAVGDRVRILDVEGTVQQLSLRSTVVRADDGTLHFFANGAIGAVANLSRRNVGRVSR